MTSSHEKSNILSEKQQQQVKNKSNGKEVIVIKRRVIALKRRVIVIKREE
jgi:hypothetical protein